VEPARCIRLSLCARVAFGDGCLACALGTGVPLRYSALVADDADARVLTQSRRSSAPRVVEIVSSRGRPDSFAQRLPAPDTERC
jgi:hypothetical protein